VIHVIAIVLISITAGVIAYAFASKAWPPKPTRTDEPHDNKNVANALFAVRMGDGSATRAHRHQRSTQPVGGSSPCPPFNRKCEVAP
jgi:hypothetical protein